MRVLITGGAGFIGSHIADQLVEAGATVAVLDDLSTGRPANVPEGVELHQADIRDAGAVRKVFESFEPTHVSHQAAQASVSVSVAEPTRDAEINVIGGLNVLEAARQAEVEAFVFASTGGAIYGEVPEDSSGATEAWPARPKSPYGAAKAAFEAYLGAYEQEHGLPAVVLRYANVYGPRQDPHGEAGVVAIFSARLLAGEGVKVFARRDPGDGGCIRDYVYAGDVARANLMALDGDLGTSPTEGAVYNVGTGIRTTTAELLDSLAGALDLDPEVEQAPPRPGDLEVSFLDCSRLKGEGWTPRVGLEAGLRRTAEAFREAREA